MISFEDLLEVFWQSHLPTRPVWSTQYRSAIFCHDAQQLEEARASRERLERRLGAKVYTEISPLDRFWRAEDYHQKYYLKVVPQVVAELRAHFPRTVDYVDSTAVARANAYADGHGDAKLFEVELPALGLSARAQAELASIARRRGLGTDDDR